MNADFDVNLHIRGVLQCRPDCGSHKAARLAVFGKEVNDDESDPGERIIDTVIGFGSSFAIEGEYFWGETYRAGERPRGRALRVLITAGRCKPFTNLIPLDSRTVKQGTVELDIGEVELTCID